MSLNRAALVFATALTLAGADKAALSDDVLRDRVMMKLAADSVVKGGGFGVDVKSGVVTLTGKVDTEQGKAKAARLARKVGGIKSVENQLVVVHK